MNTRQKEFFVEKPLHFVLDVAVPWFIMVITYTPKKGLGTSKSEDTSVQIVTVHHWSSVKELFPSPHTLFWSRPHHFLFKPFLSKSFSVYMWIQCLTFIYTH